MPTIEQRETTRLELQGKLDAAKSQAARNRLGQFSTPPGLALEIVTYALSLLAPRSKIRFLEPGFGSGPFYSSLLRAAPASRIEASVGYEIDPHHAEAAKEIWKGTGLRLHIADFTRAQPPTAEGQKFNLVVCNPPYVRHHHLSQTQKRELQVAAGRYINLRMDGLGGLYTYFLVLSKAWMTENGVGAWLIPSEFMDVNYGRRVKQFLLEKVTLNRIHRFDPEDIQFGDALVSSAVVFFRNALPQGNHEVEFSFGGAIMAPAVLEVFKRGDLLHVSKWTQLPMANSGARTRTGETLSDLFTIKRGLATGCNKFFVLTPERAAEWNLPQEFLIPILPSPRYLETEEILADQHGNPRIKSRLFLLACDLAEAEVQDRHPALWKYLSYGVETGVHTRYLCRHRDPWYSQEKRPPAPFLCTYMGRGSRRTDVPFRFILNHSKATAANVYLMLYPKPPLAFVLRDDPDVAKALWRAFSSLAREELTREGRVYGGGLHKMEPNELGNVRAGPLLNVLSDRGVRLGKQLELFGG